MRAKKFREAIERLKEDVGDALIATDIFSAQDGMPIASYNSNPKASALFNLLTNNIMKTLRGAGFPNLGRYFMMDLEDNKIAFVLPLGEYRWGMLIDSSKTQLGLLINIALPDALKSLEEALAVE